MPTPDEFNTVRNTIISTPSDQLGVAVLPKRVVAEDDQFEEDLVVAVLPETLGQMALANKRYLFGTSYADVVNHSLIALATARNLGAPQYLVHDLIFSIFVAYTVARDWVSEYNNLHSTSVLRHFEIDGRVVDRSDPLFAKSAWVNTSRMNSTACHILGYMAVEIAEPGGSLSALKTSKGTPFSDLSKTTEQGKLITEAAKALSAQDREALALFRREFKTLVRVVDLLLGETNMSLEEAAAKAAAFKPAEF